MKTELLIIALPLFLSSCYKTDEFKLSYVSESKVLIPTPQTDTTWDNPQGTYPNVMHIKYTAYPISVNEYWHGTKDITLLIDENEAQVGDTVTRSSLSKGFRIVYIKPDSVSEDSITDWKNALMETIVKYKTETGYNTITECISKNPDTTDNYGGDYSRSRHLGSISVLNDSIENCIGNAMGRDRIKWKVFLWESEIIEPIVINKGWHYPVYGKVSYELDDDGEKTVQVLDYGNGEKDIFAKLTIYGVTHDISLPLEPPGKYQFVYGNYH